jgi:hypothetical protein
MVRASKRLSLNGWEARGGLRFAQPFGFVELPGFRRGPAPLVLYLGCPAQPGNARGTAAGTSRAAHGCSTRNVQECAMGKDESKQQQTRPPQKQEHQPGRETPMRPPPKSFAENYVGSGRMQGKTALVTGGDSGIGRATAIAFAKEGADVAIAFLEECEDARLTRQAIERCGRRALSFAVDLGDEEKCKEVVDAVLRTWGRLDVLVNNAGEQHPQESIEQITRAQLEQTFRTNIFAMFYLVRAALPHMKKGARIINCTSVTAYRGSPHLIDYAATKGADYMTGQVLHPNGGEIINA